MKNIKYFFQYMKDKEVSTFKKSLIWVSLLYFVLPTDIVSDFLIGIGWIDDAAVAAFVWNYVRSEIGAYISKNKNSDSNIIHLKDKRNKKQS